MIFFRDCFVKIWETTEKEKYTDVRMSTSEKDNREQGKYINSYWSGRCVGKANTQIKSLDTQKAVKVKTAKITNEPYTDKEGNKKSFVRVTIFEFDEGEGNYTPAQTASTPAPSAPAKTPSESVEDYPF